LSRLYPSTPDQAQRLAKRLFYVGFALCTIGALLVTVLATPIVRLIYGVAGDVTGDTLQSAAGIETAIVLAWLIWQAPLFFIELYTTTWLLVVAQTRVAFGLSLFHVLLLALMLPSGALFFGAVGAAWGALAAQAFAAGLCLWMMGSWLRLRVA
jgi:O-antigen/teichoic acid export membrane protein